MRIVSRMLFLLCIWFLSWNCTGKNEIYHAQGEMAGEVSPTSVILQSRITSADSLVMGNVPGVAGIARFEISKNDDMKNSSMTHWLKAEPENDYIIKTKVENLEPATRYFYRLNYGKVQNRVRKGKICTFRTLSGQEIADSISLIIVTGMHYDHFHNSKWEHYYPSDDKELGYPAFEVMTRLKSDYFVGTGDNVYYDGMEDNIAKTPHEIRKKYREQFVQSRLVRLFSKVGTFWEKDDHDYRFNDSDPYMPGEPSHELGIRMFLEQLPVVDPEDRNPKTYRTYYFNKHLQVWFIEGRDYRSPNKMPDGPEKSIWGKEQKKWLERTLVESNATFKLLISPTPMVGPDGITKIDNHVNPRGFRYEADLFFHWLTENGFLEKHLYIVCGDRHWRYHSIHPSGFEEFSCGVPDKSHVTNQLYRRGQLVHVPGNSGSSDPEGKINQVYGQKELIGGFLMVALEPDKFSSSAKLQFIFYSEDGRILYQNTKFSN